MKKTLSLVAMLIFWSTSALAINVQFDFDIFSSGQDIYACNAGLMHAPHDARVCFKREDRSQVCNPSSCTTAEECDCVCTGSLITNVQDGEWRLDYMKGSKAAWSDHGMAANTATAFNIIAGRGTTANMFNEVVNSTTAPRLDRFNTELRSLSFQLGSERFGAEYYLDVCFRASQVDYSSIINELNHSLRRTVTITDLTSLSYSTLSGLEIKSVVACYNKTANADFSGNVTWSHATNWTAFNSSTAINFGAQNIHKKNIDGCTVRYYFRESRREGITSLRPWTAQEARVCTYTEFNESEL